MSPPDAAAATAVLRQLRPLAARRVVLEMRARDDIGDDAFHKVKEELDWVEMGIGTRG